MRVSEQSKEVGRERGRAIWNSNEAPALASSWAVVRGGRECRNGAQQKLIHGFENGDSDDDG